MTSIPRGGNGPATSTRVIGVTPPRLAATPAPPAREVLIDQFEVGLVHERRGLQRLIWALVTEVSERLCGATLRRQPGSDPPGRRHRRWSRREATASHLRAAKTQRHLSSLLRRRRHEYM